jgi:hypothetical protein
VLQFQTSGLTGLQIEVLKKVGQILNPFNFYLADGTAVSIYYGHRRSVDLDWFTSMNSFDPLQFAQFLRDEGLPFITESTDRGTLYGTAENIRLSLLEYRYPLLQLPNFWEEGCCFLASLDDLACMKLAAVAQRGARRDFIDIYVLLKEYKSLPDLLALYRQKYRLENVTPVLMGLVYFDDAEDEPDPPLWSVAWEQVKKSIAEQVREI